MGAILMINQKMRDNLLNDPKHLSEIINNGIDNIEQYNLKIIEAIRSVNSKYNVTSIGYDETPVPIIGNNAMNAGRILENGNTLAYVFITNPHIGARNIFGSQQLFPGMSVLISEFIKSSNFELANLPIYFINGSFDTVTPSMFESIVGMSIMGIKYISPFGEFRTKNLANKSLEQYSNLISNLEYNSENSIIETDYYIYNKETKSIKFTNNSFGIGNLDSFGSKDRFFVMKSYPALMLADKEGVSIEVEEISEFLRIHQRGRNNIEPFLSYAKKLEMKRKYMRTKQIIYYGAPGTGKSFLVEESLQKNQILQSQIFRTTFHPEYSYYDFIGQILPVVKDQEITYDFKSGVFTDALKRAFSDRNTQVYLVLEEMSRGNVAAIFGDIFQLLDRDDKNVSRYPIRNTLIAKEIRQLDNDENLIFLPSNLNILGTVNTSDQNVFVMDTAFKRRFDWKYISTKPVKDSEGNILDLNNVDLDISELNVEGKVTWFTFYQILNSFVTDKIEGLGLSEDKQIGQFFIIFNSEITKHEIQEKIKEQLLHYLWTDVHLASESLITRLFDAEMVSFSDLYDKFDNKERVFSNYFIEYFRKKRIQTDL